MHISSILNHNSFDLYTAIQEKDHDLTCTILTENPLLLYTHLHNEGTALHIFVRNKALDILSQFKKIVPTKVLKNILHLQDSNGNTPLHIAIAGGNKQVIEHVILDDMDQHCLTIQNNEGQSLVHFLALYGCDDLFEQFYNSNAPTLLQGSELKNNKGETPLHISAKHDPEQKELSQQRLKIMRLFMQQGKLDRFAIPDNSSDTALHIAALTNNMEAIALLIKNETIRAFAFHKNADGDNILHIAMRYHPQHLPSLIKNNLPSQEQSLILTEKNNRGLSPIDMARKIVTYITLMQKNNTKKN